MMAGLLALSACSSSLFSIGNDPLTAEAVEQSRDDLPEVYESDCYASESSTVLTAGTVDDCIRTNRGAEFSVALVGDSHSAHWSSPIEAIAEKNGWELTYFGKRGCSLEDNTAKFRDQGAYDACTEWSDALMKQLLDKKYDVVIASNYSRAKVVVEGSVLDGEVNERVRAEGLKRTWESLQRVGSDVVVIIDTPYLGSDTPACLMEHLDDPGACNASFEEAVLNVPHPEKLAAKQTEGVEVIDMTESFCPKLDRCDASKNGMVVFRDKHHMTASFASSLTAPLEQKMAKTSALGAHTS